MSHQCQLNKEPGQETRAKRLKFFLFWSHDQNQINSLFVWVTSHQPLHCSGFQKSLTNLWRQFWSCDQNRWAKKPQSRISKQPDFLTRFFYSIDIGVIKANLGAFWFVRPCMCEFFSFLLKVLKPTWMPSGLKGITRYEINLFIFAKHGCSIANFQIIIT